MRANIKGPHLDFWGGPNSLSHGSGCDEPCFCSYARTQHFLLLRSCAYFNSLGKCGFRP